MARKRGSEVVPGDIIEFFGEPHRVESVEPYTHPTLGAFAGIAKCADGWSMTLEDTVMVTVV